MKARQLNVIGYLVFAAAIVGWTLAAYLYFFPDEPGAGVDDPDREFPALAIGNNEVHFRLHNPTRHDVRVVGYQFC